MTEREYQKARARLDVMHKAIDDAPRDRVPVFYGIAALHDKVMKYERSHGIDS